MAKAVYIAFDTAFPFLSIYLKDTITDMHGDVCRVLFTEALFLTVEKGQEPQSPIRDRKTTESLVSAE